MNSPTTKPTAVLVGGACFNEQLHIGLWADMSDMLSAGLDAEGIRLDRTGPTCCVFVIHKDRTIR